MLGVSREDWVREGAWVKREGTDSARSRLECEQGRVCGGGKEMVQDVNSEDRPLNSSSVAEQVPGRVRAGEEGGKSIPLLPDTGATPTFPKL